MTGIWIWRRLLRPSEIAKNGKGFSFGNVVSFFVRGFGFGFVTCKWRVFTYLLLRLKRGFLRGFSCEIAHSHRSHQHSNYNFFFSFRFFFFFNSF